MYECVKCLIVISYPRYGVIHFMNFSNQLNIVHNVPSAAATTTTIKCSPFILNEHCRGMYRGICNWNVCERSIYRSIKSATQQQQQRRRIVCRVENHMECVYSVPLIIFGIFTMILRIRGQCFQLNKSKKESEHIDGQ